MVHISSGSLEVAIEEHGAQLRSLLDRRMGIERLWGGDPAVWASSSPVVFPVIGKLNDLTLHVDGVPYHMKSNGLIRYMDPVEVLMGEGWAEFRFASTDETMSSFPFPWRFVIRYEIDGVSLAVRARIENPGTGPLWYNYAGHPGFRVPVHSGETCDDYYIEFERPETVSVYDVCETGQLAGGLTPFFDGERRFFIRKELFKTEALAFHAPASRYVSLKSLARGEELRVWIEGFDNVAVWTPYLADEPLRFVCIETWIGHSDFKGYAGEFSERDGIARIEAGCAVEHEYRVEVM